MEVIYLRFSRHFCRISGSRLPTTAPNALLAAAAPACGVAAALLVDAPAPCRRLNRLTLAVASMPDLDVWGILEVDGGASAAGGAPLVAGNASSGVPQGDVRSIVTVGLVDGYSGSGKLMAASRSDSHMLGGGVAPDGIAAGSPLRGGSVHVVTWCR